jgi:hypothetical protein
MAIQLGPRGVWPAIEEDDPADQEVESFRTHARRSIMRDRISKKNQKKSGLHRDDGSWAELGALGVGRKEPTGCDSIIEMHEAESFRTPDSFQVIPMGSPHSPAKIRRQQLAQGHSEYEQPVISNPVYHPMSVAGHQRLQDRRAGRTRSNCEEIPSVMSLGARGSENPLYPDVRQEFTTEEEPTASGCTESEASGSYVNQPSGHP